jgi:hypothetical protein
MEKELATSSYNPSVGCGYNNKRVFIQDEKIIFESIGWRTFDVFEMPKKNAEKACEIMIENSFNITSTFKDVYHYFEGGCLCTKKQTLEESRNEFTKNVWNELQSILWDFHHYRGGVNSPLQKELSASSRVYRSDY